MSIEVELGELAEAASRYRFAYLVTVDETASPHIVAVAPVIADGAVTIRDIGRRTRQNIAARSRATLAFPPSEVDGYSLIVDGGATLDDDGARIDPSRAVLHRPAPRPGGATGPGGCVSDCVELPVAR